MVFSSYSFLFLFLPITLALYYLMPKRNLKNLVLFGCSLVFYSWGEPVYIVLMLVSILNDYSMSRLIDINHKKKRMGRAKLFLIISFAVNLGLLGFFKYYGFAVENINQVFNLKLIAHQLPLPIGISFYTFQTMSYTIDVYRGKTKVQKNLLTLSTYVALFPQLIAGPIVRYIDIEHELEHRTESLQLFSQGTRRFILGLAKKVLIANPMGFLADSIYGGQISEHSSLILWLAALGFTLQIYFDFSGYSDMAIGLGKMFGFNFLENFNYPYISKSITDFWRRWHISLTTWFRDYLYIPLGGNRVSRLKWLRNILIVWFVTGLWHGASWNYIIWGLYYFVILLFEKFLIGGLLKKMPKIFAHIYTLFIVVIGWVIFRIEDFAVLKEVLYRMFSFQPIDMASVLLKYQSILYTLPYIIIGIIASMPIIPKVEKWLENKSSGFKLVFDCYVFALLGITIV
ncbi:MAG: MBOAT family protein [Vallitaleaceae bacterium]|jgi:alginate O-acetyltransferase complex protein AlgI|nr:MBOAT family protein [Vallitaleaceae bacterium]